MVLGQLDIHVLKVDPFFTPYTKIYSKLITDLGIKAKTVNLFAENIGVNLCNLGLGNHFFFNVYVFMYLAASSPSHSTWNPFIATCRLFIAAWGISSCGMLP